MEARKVPPRKDGRIIVHFDYDCFYASVFEAKNPSLKSLPFAVQQKQIIVTCNYEARRQGLHKLMLIRDAKRVCPEVIIELGEDISGFRDASKELYNFVKEFCWSERIERLGFDEVWLDVTDLIDYNMELISKYDLEHSFFQMSRDDPTKGFAFDATSVAGHTYPKNAAVKSAAQGPLDQLILRLTLGSHLAMYIRKQLEEQKGYTSTVGIATNKLLSKLVGNMNKPQGQTTLMPPLVSTENEASNVVNFMDEHEIGKVPGIGFKLAQRLREYVLQRPVEFDWADGGTKENVTVATVRKHPSMDYENLEKILAGPGSPRGIGYKIWCLLHGIDDTEVSQARAIPKQISIEDSYIRLDTMPELLKELHALASSLLRRMRIDLTGDDDFEEKSKEETAMTNPTAAKRWLAHPRTLRLTTRPRLPLLSDGTRPRAMKRISHSCPLPNFVFDLHDNIDALADKLVRETLIGMFRKLHPERTGWNLSLVNLAVTNMAETAGDSKTANGRDIGNMFRKQDDVLKDFKVIDEKDEVAIEDVPHVGLDGNTMVDGGEMEDGWDDTEEMDERTEMCHTCHSRIPAFAMIAHLRFHSPGIQ